MNICKKYAVITGLIQTNSSLKNHVQQLEGSLAEKETSLEDVESEMESLKRESGEKEREYVVKIQQLEEEQTTEKDAQRELRKQVSHGVPLKCLKKIYRFSTLI